MLREALAWPVASFYPLPCPSAHPCASEKQRERRKEDEGEGGGVEMEEQPAVHTLVGGMRCPAKGKGGHSRTARAPTAPTSSQPGRSRASRRRVALSPSPSPYSSRRGGAEVQVRARRSVAGGRTRLPTRAGCMAPAAWPSSSQLRLCLASPRPAMVPWLLGHAQAPAPLLLVRPVLAAAVWAASAYGKSRRGAPAPADCGGVGGRRGREIWDEQSSKQSVAIMTKAYPNIERNELIVLQEIATYMLLACGAVYIIAGILCLGVLKRSRQHKATSHEQAVKDLEELEKRREELESLLVAKQSETA